MTKNSSVITDENKEFQKTSRKKKVVSAWTGGLGRDDGYTFGSVVSSRGPTIGCISESAPTERKTLYPFLFSMLSNLHVSLVLALTVVIQLPLLNSPFSPFLKLHAMVPYRRDYAQGGSPFSRPDTSLVHVVYHSLSVHTLSYMGNVEPCVLRVGVHISTSLDCL